MEEEEFAKGFGSSRRLALVKRRKKCHERANETGMEASWGDVLREGKLLWKIEREERSPSRNDWVEDLGLTPLAKQPIDSRSTGLESRGRIGPTSKP